MIELNDARTLLIAFYGVITVSTFLMLVHEFWKQIDDDLVDVLVSVLVALIFCWFWPVIFVYKGWKYAYYKL